MNATPPLSQVMDKDASHLKLLSIFHFINAALLLAGIAFLIGHYLFMQMIIDQIEAHPDTASKPVPPEVQHLLLAFYSFIGVGLLFVAALNIFSAISMRQRKRRMLSLITAGLNCIQFPLGVALGAFTIIVLCRDSVRAKYDAVTDAEAAALED